MSHNWSAAAADALSTRADIVRQAPQPVALGELKIKFSDRDEDVLAGILALTARLDQDRCIYTIEADDNVDVALLRELFVRARRDKTGVRLALPQINSADTGRVLYVGSSCATGKRTNSLRRRLTQHLLAAPTGTYALNLSKWTRPLRTGGVIVRAYHYLGASRDIVTDIEDHLSAVMKPHFGRRGTQR